MFPACFLFVCLFVLLYFKSGKRLQWMPWVDASWHIHIVAVRFTRHSSHSPTSQKLILYGLRQIAIQIFRESNMHWTHKVIVIVQYVGAITQNALCSGCILRLVKVAKGGQVSSHCGFLSVWLLQNVLLLSDYKGLTLRSLFPPKI